MNPIIPINISLTPEHTFTWPGYTQPIMYQNVGVKSIFYRIFGKNVRLTITKGADTTPIYIAKEDAWKIINAARIRYNPDTERTGSILARALITLQKTASLQTTAGQEQPSPSPISTTVKPDPSIENIHGQEIVGKETDIDILRQSGDPNQCMLIDFLKSQGISCRTIRGDGHCAFRAIATWALSTFPAEALQKFIDESTATMLQDSFMVSNLPYTIKTVADTARQAIDSFRKTGRMTHEQSNNFIHFLRILAASKVLDAVRKQTYFLENETPEQYLIKMTAMKGLANSHGGEIEIAKLMEVFQHDWTILNFSSIVDPSGFAAKHLKTFITSGKNLHLLKTVASELKKYQRSDLASKILELEKLPVEEAKKEAHHILKQIEALDQKQRNQRVEGIASELIKPGAIILSYRGNGHYDLLLKKAK